MDAWRPSTHKSAFSVHLRKLHVSCHDSSKLQKATGTVVLRIQARNGGGILSLHHDVVPHQKVNAGPKVGRPLTRLLI